MKAESYGWYFPPTLFLEPNPMLVRTVHLLSCLGACLECWTARLRNPGPDSCDSEGDSNHCVRLLLLNHDRCPAISSGIPDALPRTDAAVRVFTLWWNFVHSTTTTTSIPQRTIRIYSLARLKAFFNVLECLQTRKFSFLL